jgi:hypothetical protein
LSLVYTLLPIGAPLDLHIAPDASAATRFVVSSGLAADREGRPPMLKFVFERELPGAGAVTPGEVHTVAATSNQVLAEMAPRLQWVQSYVTADSVYCVYLPGDEATVRDHSDRVGVPVIAVHQVTSTIDPVTGA